MNYGIISEYERLGGTLPEEIESIIKLFARPRSMKPKHCGIMKECIYNNDAGWWPPALIPLWGGTEAQLQQYLIDNNYDIDIQ